MSVEHYPWCAAVQNMARPRSQQLIGPMCECEKHRKNLADLEAWLASDEGQQTLDDMADLTFPQPQRSKTT